MLTAKHLQLAISLVVVCTTPAVAQQPKQWAVLIAVQNHQNPKLNLRYTVNDAVQMKETLIKRAGMSSDAILEMTDQSPVNLRPTLANLRSELPRFLKQAQKNDRVIVFFSGHGVLQKGQTYLCPFDYALNQPEATGFPAAEIRQALSACPAQTKFLILDCCHAGGDRAGAREDATAEEVARAVEPERINGCVVLAACTAKEFSWEWQERKHGVFTYWLCRALEGGADSDGNGQLQLDSVYNYVHERTTKTTKQVFNQSQTPVRIIGAGVAGELVVLTLRPEPPESLCRRLAEHLDLEIRRQKLGKVGVLEFLQPLGKIEGLGPANLPAYFADRVRQGLKTLAGSAYAVLDEGATKDAAKGVKVEGLTQTKALQVLNKKEGLQALIYGILRPQGPQVDLQANMVETATGRLIYKFSGRLPLSEDLVGDFGGSFDNTDRPQGGPYAAPVVNHVLDQTQEGNPLLKQRFPFRVEIHSVLAGPGETITDKTPRKKKDFILLAADGDGDKKRMDLLVPAREGEIFELYFWNNTGNSVAATVLVDGLNTFGQKRERLGLDARSWVMAPSTGKSRSYIDGWYIPKRAGAQQSNLNDFTVKRFQFVDVAKSVAARQGFHESIGLITAAFYAEKGRSLGVGEGPEEARQLQTANFTPGRLLGVVNIRYVDENDTRLRKN